MPSLLHNVRFNFLSFLAGKALAATTAILLPRFLHVQNMGLYTAAWGMAAIVSTVSDFGLASYLTREVSLRRNEVGELFYRAMAMQLIQLVLAAGLLGMVVWMGQGGGLSAGLIVLAFVVSALASMASPVSAALQGMEQFKVTGIVTTIASCLNAVAIALALWLRPEPSTVFAALAISALANLLLWAASLRRLKLAPRIPGSWNLGAFFRGELDFAMVSVSNQLYLRVDLLILSFLAGPLQVGKYGVAVILTDRISPMLVALAGPLYPRITADFKDETLHRALRYLAAFCLPLGVGGSLLALPMMPWIFGAEYADSGLAFRWLIWVPAILGVHQVFLHAMNALGKTRQMAAIFMGNFALNVGLNFLLIPKYGFVAAAALSTLCEVVIMAASAWVLVKNGFVLGLRRWLWPALPAALGMGLLLWALPAPQGPQVLLWALAGALVYGLLLWALGFMGAEERMHFRRLLGREA